MYRFYLVTLLLLLRCVGAWCADTTDKLVLNRLTLNPGGDTGWLTVSVNGSSLYTGFEMDIQLPHDVSICYDDLSNPIVELALSAPTIFPSTTDAESGEQLFSHSMACSYNAIGQDLVRVSCISIASESLKAVSGRLLNIKVKVGPYARPGVYEWSVTDATLITTAGGQVKPTSAPASITVSTNGTVPVSISDVNKFSTCILPFGVGSLPSGLHAYKSVTIENDSLYLLDSKTMAAYTPYILFAPDGVNATLQGQIDTAQYVSSATDGYLVGVLQDTSISEGFILQNHGQGVGFYMVAPYTFGLPAGKCYLQLDESMSSVALRITQSENAIEQLENEATKPQIFDLQGRSLVIPLQGVVNLMGGKKVIVL